MIRVLLSPSDDGLLHSCEAHGHAEFAPRGYDIVCASVTSLLRTVLAQFEKSQTLVLETKSFNRGMLAFSVKNYGKDDKFLLKYAMDFLQTGLSQIAEEYPDCVEMRVLKK